MTEEEFDDYVSGKSIPSESWENYFSESLHSMEEMSNDLLDMKTRHDTFLQNVDTLRTSMQQKHVRFNISLVEQILCNTN